MTDIVERLRERFLSGCDADAGILHEAADEIERLRAALTAIARSYTQLDVDCSILRTVARRALEPKP